MKTKLLNLRVTPEEFERWSKWAEDDTESLSAWIRNTLNAHDEIAAAIFRKHGAKQPSIPAVDVKTEISKPKVKGCAHGAAKGFNCWQCGGIAKVE